LNDRHSFDTIFPSSKNELEMEVQQEVVHSELGPYLSGLRGSVAAAVEAYEKNYEGAMRRIHSKRSAASIIHDHIVYNMAEFAENREGVELRWLANLWLLSFPEGYLVRFKKVGSAKLPAGYRTKQVRKYRNHQQLDGLPKSVNLDLSYQLDSLGKLQAVFLICPSGTSSNMWHSVVNDDGARPVVVSLFGTPTEPQGATLLPKKRDTKDDSQSSDGDSSA